MFWIIPALAAHISNAAVFVVDKGILGSGGKIGKPARYAAYSSLVAAGAAVLFFVSPAAPTVFVLTWGLLAGALWVAALWLYFTAMKNGEVSRVVPLTGSAVPLFTLIFATLFLGEQLATQQLIAALLLIIGGAVLSLTFKDVQGLPAHAVLAAVCAGAAFAAHFAVMKLVYSNFSPFLSAFAYSRIGVGVSALALLGGISLSRPKEVVTQEDVPQSSKKNLWLAFWGSKTLGMVALLLQNWAISLGSVSLVNALQGAQYVVVLVIAAMFSRIMPQLYAEQVGRYALAQKLIGIACVSVGIVILL